jgi:SAM-dependent methyltransferase
LPLLGPGADVFEKLIQYPTAVLRQAIEKRGLVVPRRATRKQLAQRLLRETIRKQAEELYARQDESFLTLDAQYPFLIKLVQKARPHRIFDIGCGTGLVAERLREVLPDDGAYVGIDHVAAGISRARERLAADARFRFEVLDAETSTIPRGTDTVLFCWVMNWLDTHTADRMCQRLGRLASSTTIIISVPFFACVEIPDTKRTSRSASAARAFLRGESPPAAWNVARYESYRRSLVTNFEVVEEHVRPGTNIFWVARPHAGPPDRQEHSCASRW